jgi:FkbM family methyltransferase
MKQLSLFDTTPQELFSENGATEECQLPANAVWCNVRAGIAGAEPYRMAVRNPAVSIVSQQICDSGTWELEEGQLAGTPPGKAIDIGANEGMYTLALAKLGWKVAAFEPLPSNQKLLEASLCANPELKKRVTLHKIALGNVTGQCDIISDNNNVDDGVMRCGDYEMYAGYGKRAVVPVHRLDDFLMQPVDYVKMDVEGFECQVLLGGQKLLSEGKPKVIQSEVQPKLQKSDICSSGDYLHMYAKNGYRVTQDKQCQTPISPISAPEVISDFYMCRT